jgi:predicted transcriptional regulator
VLQGAVAQFVDNTLQGSVSPFVAYLSQRQQVSDNELAELEALVAQLNRAATRAEPWTPRC